MQNKLICLKIELPLWTNIHKSFTVGVWMSNGAVQCYGYVRSVYRVYSGLKYIGKLSYAKQFLSCCWSCLKEDWRWTKTCLTDIKLVQMFFCQLGLAHQYTRKSNITWCHHMRASCNASHVTLGIAWLKLHHQHNVPLTTSLVLAGDRDIHQSTKFLHLFVS